MQEAKDRTNKHIRTIDEYLGLRRDTIGVELCIVILEIGANLPDDAVRHPVIKKLSSLAAEMILLDNVSQDTSTTTARLTVIVGHDLI